MNNVLFIINNDVLHYLTIEGDNGKSKIFKELNKLHPKTYLVKNNKYKIDNLLFKEIQAHKLSIIIFFNTLMIATLYKNQVFFYIPTFFFRF